MKPFNHRKIALARLLRPLWAVLGLLFPRAPASGEPRSILVFDFHLIGDIVMLTPLLAALRGAYPRAHIALVAGPWAGEVLQGLPYVDELVEFAAPWVKYGQGLGAWRNCLGLLRRLRQQPWDLGVEVRGDVRQILLLALAGARRRVGYDFSGGGGLLTDVVTPGSGDRHIAADYHRRLCEHLGIWREREYLPQLRLTADEQLAASARGPFIGIHFGASLALRIPGEAMLDAFVSGLAAGSRGPFVVYHLREAPQVSQRLLANLGECGVPATSWAGSLREFICHVSRCRHLYALDSGPAHVAAALGVTVSVIYGPSLPEMTRPLGRSVRIIDGRVLSCRPCDQRRCRNKRFQQCFAPPEDWLGTEKEG